MMRTSHFLFVWVVPFLCLVLQNGCSSAATKFYVLTPAARTTAKPPAGQGHLNVGVGPIELPSYLDRPQFVSRTPGNELELAEFNQWAEPLQDGFMRVLGENLSRMVPTDRVTLFPWRRADAVDYQVVVQVIRFEASTEGEASLDARWSIARGDGKSALVSKKSSYRAAGKAGDHDALAAAMSETLHELSREIARAIQSLPVQPAGS